VNRVECLLTCDCGRPIISVILGCVPSDLRAFGYSVSLFVAHLIGDFPSPTVVGLLKVIARTCLCVAA
jgi:hypothetical protein